MSDTELRSSISIKSGAGVSSRSSTLRWAVARLQDPHLKYLPRETWSWRPISQSVLSVTERPTLSQRSASFSPPWAHASSLIPLSLRKDSWKPSFCLFTWPGTISSRSNYLTRLKLTSFCFNQRLRFGDLDGTSEEKYRVLARGGLQRGRAPFILISTNAVSTIGGGKEPVP